MTSEHIRIGGLAALATIVFAAAAGCGSGADGTPSAGASNASIKIDGSETVFPIVDAMGEDFHGEHPEVKTVVNKSGTGSGFQKFIRGDIDIATASRPITESEEDSLRKANIEFMEIPIAYDAVCVVVNPRNTAVVSLSPSDLKKAWSDGSKVVTWADWRPGGSPSKINFYGPTTNHGTFDYFTEAINGKKGNMRSDYQPNQDYNVVIQDVAGDKDGIGYCGLNYLVENKDKVKAVAIDSGKGPVLPSEQTVDDGAYTPLSRPLFFYVNKTAYGRPEVKAFLDYALSEGGANAVKEAKYVVLPQEVLTEIKKRLSAGAVGSIFEHAKPGEPTARVLASSK